MNCSCHKYFPNTCFFTEDLSSSPEVFGWLKFFWNVLNARLTMSLSPILSIMRDFLIVRGTGSVVCGTGSGLLGPKLIDKCKDLVATFLSSTLEVTCFLGKDCGFPFLVEVADANVLVGADIGFELLGVEI